MAFQDLKNKNEEAVLKAKFEATEDALKRAAKAAKADTHNFFIYNECIKFYKNKMEKELEDTNTYHRDGSLQRIHDSAKNNALAQVYDIEYIRISNMWKLIFIYFKQFHEKHEDSDQVSALCSRLENEIDTSYIKFQQQNDQKRREFMVNFIDATNLFTFLIVICFLFLLFTKKF